jgi:hypothetical protein
VSMALSCNATSTTDRLPSDGMLALRIARL